MINLTQAPETVCKKLAQDFLFALINRDYGIILGKISHEHGKWTRERLQSELLAITDGRWVSEFMAINSSAAPRLSGDATLYEYRHRLPIDGRWTDTALVLRLHQKNGTLYAVELVGFRR